MSNHRREEVLRAYEALVDLRDRVAVGEAGWDCLGDYFTENAVFIDPAWGRIEGIVAIRRFLVESMAGLEGWTFPHQWTLVDGDRLVSGWMNRLPGQRADGSFYEALGISVMTYAGAGRFSREEDLLNMVHVLDLIRESGWTPGPGFNPPPANPPR